MSILLASDSCWDVFKILARVLVRHDLLVRLAMGCAERFRSQLIGVFQALRPKIHCNVATVAIFAFFAVDTFALATLHLRSSAPSGDDLLLRFPVVPVCPVVILFAARRESRPRPQTYCVTPRRLAGSPGHGV